VPGAGDHLPDLHDEVYDLGEFFNAFKNIRTVPSCNPAVTGRDWRIRNVVSQAHSIFLSYWKQPVKQINDTFIDLINGYIPSDGIRFVTLQGFFIIPNGV